MNFLRLNWLPNLKIAHKLLLGFGLILALMTLLGVFAITRMQAMHDVSAEIRSNWLPSVRVTSDLNGATAYFRTQEFAHVVSTSDEDMAAVEKRIVHYQGLVADMRATYEPLISDQKERALYDAFSREWDAYSKMHEQLLVISRQNRTEEARTLLTTESRKHYYALSDVLTKLADLNVRGANAAAERGEQVYDNAVMAILAALAIAMLAGTALGVVISRSITRPVRKAVQVADAVAEGRLDNEFKVFGRDEGAQLLGAMNRMQSGLKDFASAQVEMGRQQDAGDVDFRVDAARFPGEYGRMAEGVNHLVQSQLAVIERLTGLLTAYSRGDLSQDIERYPGKKAQVTASVDAVKAGMIAVNAEIQTLVDAAMAGDFTYRGDAERSSNRALIERFNTLMATVDSGLGEVGRVLSAVADGDLTRRVDVVLPGQLGRLADDANTTVDQLTQIARTIKDASDSINSAAGEISSGNTDLSQRTEQQAAALEETASSMEELTSTVRQNAENANHANRLARGAAEVATQGGEVVGQVQSTMAEIEASSRKVADIVSVIEGIAFQTNILALNAAVEAARAGDQGRGFAVVASEVRSLAQRSATASKDIKQLIAASSLKVDQGAELVAQAGQAMTGIVESVQRVTGIIADIAAASVEQSAGIEQINQAVTHMDEGTQQNAALVEEATASARALEQQAEQLVQTVAVFKLADSAMPQAAATGTRNKHGMRQPHEAKRAASGALAGHTARPSSHHAKRAVRSAPSMAGNDGNWQEF
ncbi:methyl-accepting chemotaxis protein [Lysobacter korlensis]|uniref:Methyl-accepting chemotaxis protein n=1 Tax=Lysobacter korlensis TaxID=553636 RepID=A0ABV6RIA0_9GAMM